MLLLKVGYVYKNFFGFIFCMSFCIFFFILVWYLLYFLLYFWYLSIRNKIESLFRWFFRYVDFVRLLMMVMLFMVRVVGIFCVK